MWRIVLVLAFGAGCGRTDKQTDKQDKPASVDTGSAKAVAVVTVPSPPPGSLAGKEPPTAESAHVELAYALARWAADTHAKLAGASVKTWLDPGTQLTLDESKVIVEHTREMMWRRENGQMHLFNEQERPPVHDVTEIDAALLGKEVTARFTIEATFAWLVLENPTGAQVVVDLWPQAPCRRVDPSKLACGDKEITLVASDGKLTLSPDRTILLAKDAKLSLK